MNLKTQANLSPKWKALLDVVAKAEGTNDRYNVRLHLAAIDPCKPAYQGCLQFVADVTTEGQAGHPGVVYQGNVASVESSVLRRSESECKRSKTGRFLATTVAGRYQLQRDVYNQVASQIGVRGFSPQSQDLVAKAMIQRRNVNADKISSFQDFEKAITALSYDWSTLPPHHYGISCRGGYYTAEQLWSTFRQQAGI